MQSGSGMTSSLHSRTINLNRRAWSGAADPGLRGTIANTTTLSRVRISRLTPTPQAGSDPLWHARKAHDHRRGHHDFPRASPILAFHCERECRRIPRGCPFRARSSMLTTVSCSARASGQLCSTLSRREEFDPRVISSRIEAFSELENAPSSN